MIGELLAHSVLVVEVETDRLHEAQVIAQQLVEPVKERYVEALVYFYRTRRPRTFAAKRIQWTRKLLTFGPSASRQPLTSSLWPPTSIADQGRDVAAGHEFDGRARLQQPRIGFSKPFHWHCGDLIRNLHCLCLACFQCPRPGIRSIVYSDPVMLQIGGPVRGGEQPPWRKPQPEPTPQTPR